MDEQLPSPPPLSLLWNVEGDEKAGILGRIQGSGQRCPLPCPCKLSSTSALEGSLVSGTPTSHFIPAWEITWAEQAGGVFQSAEFLRASA